MHSNFGRVQSKILQPTLSIQQQNDSKKIAEKSFITSNPNRFITSNEVSRKGMENN